MRMGVVKIVRSDLHYYDVQEWMIACVLRDVDQVKDVVNSYAGGKWS